MGDGALRNAPCWCGSGLKLKKCHLDRESQPRLNPFETEEKVRRRRSKECLHPNKAECTRTIVRAHTIQRGRGLAAIAENGHVVGLDASRRTLEDRAGRIGVRSVGLKQASTITGFCSFHDDAVFAPVEKQPFVGTQEQCFLLAYRTVCREYYTKKNALSTFDLLRASDRGRSVADQVLIQRFADLNEIGGQAGLQDIQAQRASYDNALERRDYSSLRYYIVWFDGPPDLMNAFGILPECDFHGQPLQDLRDAGKGLDGISVSMVATERGSALVLAWMPDVSMACTRLAESLNRVSDADLSNAVVRLFFEFSENTYMRPSWWEALPLVTQEALLDRISDTANVLVVRKPTCLMSDGRNYATWRVLTRESNAITVLGGAA